MSELVRSVVDALRSAAGSSASESTGVSVPMPGGHGLLFMASRRELCNAYLRHWSVEERAYVLLGILGYQDDEAKTTERWSARRYRMAAALWPELLPRGVIDGASWKSCPPGGRWRPLLDAMKVLCDESPTFQAFRREVHAWHEMACQRLARGDRPGATGRLITTLATASPGLHPSTLRSKVEPEWDWVRAVLEAHAPLADVMLARYFLHVLHGELTCLPAAGDKGLHHVATGALRDMSRAGVQAGHESGCSQAMAARLVHAIDEFVHARHVEDPRFRGCLGDYAGGPVPQLHDLPDWAAEVDDGALRNAHLLAVQLADMLIDPLRAVSGPRDGVRFVLDAYQKSHSRIKASWQGGSATTASATSPVDAEDDQSGIRAKAHLPPAVDGQRHQLLMATFSVYKRPSPNPYIDLVKTLVEGLPTRPALHAERGCAQCGTTRVQGESQ